EFADANVSGNPSIFMRNKICLITSCKTNFYAKVDVPTTLNINIKISKITKFKVEANAVVKNHKKIKIASGNY
mgnify:CR=1